MAKTDGHLADELLFDVMDTSDLLLSRSQRRRGASYAAQRGVSRASRSGTGRRGSPRRPAQNSDCEAKRQRAARASLAARLGAQPLRKFQTPRRAARGGQRGEPGGSANGFAVGLE